MKPLEVVHLSKAFHAAHGRRQAVEGVSFAVEAGEIMSLLGPNGAGKSSTVRAILGLLQPDTGWVRVQGLDPHRHAAAQRHLGAVLEGGRQLYGRMTVRENALYFAALKGLPADEARRALDAWLPVFRLDHRADALVQTLSRGMQQKLSLLCALLHRPAVLVLDEPTLALDREATDRVVERVQALAAEGTAVLLATHQMDLAERLSTSVGVMAGGRVLVKEATEALLARYAPVAYHVALEPGAAVGESRLRALTRRFVTHIAQGGIRIHCGPDRLHEALALLAPLPIAHLRNLRSDLSQLVQHVLEGHAYGPPAVSGNSTGIADLVALSG